MPDSPKKIAGKLKVVTGAWEDLAPEKSFGGMTLEQFKEAIKPSWKAREDVKTYEIALMAAQDQRDDADKESRRLMQLVVNGVKGDPSVGEDSGLYEAMGYVRKSERKSGLTNKGKKPKTVAG